MDIFVKKNSEVNVVVFVWAESDTIGASNIEEEVPKGLDTKKVRFVFRKTNYKDSSRIMQRAKLQNVTLSTQETEGNNLSADLVGMQDEMLRSQLVKIIDGEKVVMSSSEVVDNLEPAVARAAIAAVFDKVGI